MPDFADALGPSPEFAVRDLDDQSRGGHVEVPEPEARRHFTDGGALHAAGQQRTDAEADDRIAVDDDELE
ncbi:hypothetical protein [Burkholderia gladioli]|uniref:hypothetical protein n=1 Tax=Burkholderia gladioli TaxID=28095 RepID=UPI001F300E1F|nr:hypothetical protein [Burkholderia gladioli]